jgi:hypothetical protein
VPDKTPYKQGYNFTAKHTSYYWEMFSKDDVTYGYLSDQQQPSLWEALNNILKSWVYRCDTSNF